MTGSASRLARSFLASTPPLRAGDSSVSDSIDRLRAALGDRYEIERELGEGGMAGVRRHVLVRTVRGVARAQVSMRRPSSPRAAPLAVATVVILCASACGPAPDPADLVLLGGPVVTLSDAGVVEGIAVRGERIVAVGSSSHVRSYVGPDTRVVVWAHDSHISKGGASTTEGNYFISSMGSYLDRIYGDDYRAFSIMSYDGSYTAVQSMWGGPRGLVVVEAFPAPVGSLEEAFDRVSQRLGASLFVTDLRPAFADPGGRMLL